MRLIWFPEVILVGQNEMWFTIDHHCGCYLFRAAFQSTDFAPKLKPNLLSSWKYSQQNRNFNEKLHKE